MEVSGQHHAPAFLPPETNSNIPLNRVGGGAGWDPEPVRAILEKRKISCPYRSPNPEPSFPREILIYSCQLSRDHRSREMRVSSAVENCTHRMILVKSVMWINRALSCRRNAVNQGFAK